MRLTQRHGLFASSLPFVFAGLAVAAAIQHAARDMARLYLVDLVAVPRAPSEVPVSNAPAPETTPEADPEPETAISP